MWTEFLNDTLLPTLLNVLSAFVTVLVGMAAVAARRWAAKQQAEWVATVTAAVTDAARVAVLKTNQTFVDDVRAAIEDGKLDRETAVAALVHARNVLKQSLGEEMWAAFVRIVGGEEQAEQAAATVIEAQVRAVKLEEMRAAASVAA